MHMSKVQYGMRVEAGDEGTEDHDAGRVITEIMGATGSGTRAYGIRADGQLMCRGYGERHGRTFGGGVDVCQHVQGEWAPVLPGTPEFAAFQARVRGC